MSATAKQVTIGNNPVRGAKHSDSLQIAKTTGIDKAAVVTVIEQFMTVVKDSLAHGENVYLRGFGSFVVKQRAEKTARNISKNTTLVIPAHNIPAFKPANVFKNEVSGLK
ncbi:HU family DNA-binding protein [Muribaculum gordoncarteri]|uniref:HU family DNA-binding protein n=3 Tax=Muribaculaceae TaxID=2005473 RepID=A0A4P7VS13_9BACT|nr:HU family DNA-binding protein [Muribaculum gordoncarteri]